MCKEHGICMLIVGLVIVLSIQFTEWNIWLVIGGLLIIKGILMMVMPPKSECCEPMKPAKGKKKK
ncbi:hypothetical protein HOE51_03515 [archaeon]|jgi:uncharacterized membrane protein HdeD (DUF308 family)|nr:hypothetical protein [archaeon]MBT4417683.1 hypothetical protein [archaeon]